MALAHILLGLALVLNAGLSLYIIRRTFMDQAALEAALTNIGTQLGDVSTQLGKGIAEVVAEIGNAGNSTAGIDRAVEKLSTAAAGLKTLSQTLDDLNKDAPPQDDAFVAVGGTRFSDGAVQTEETLAAAVAAWNTAHPEGPVAG